MYYNALTWIIEKSTLELNGRFRFSLNCIHVLCGDSLSDDLPEALLMHTLTCTVRVRLTVSLAHVLVVWQPAGCHPFMGFPNSVALPTTQFSQEKEALLYVNPCKCVS